MKWIFSLLLLLGCETHSKWRCQTFAERQGDAVCLFYQSPDPVMGIDVEILSTKEHTSVYLQVHTTLPPAKKTEVTLSTTQKTLKFLADIHLGQQRIRLPEEIQTEFLSILREEKPLTIEFLSYKEVLETQQFEQLFNSKPSILKRFIDSYSSF